MHKFTQTLAWTYVKIRHKKLVQVCCTSFSYKFLDCVSAYKCGPVLIIKVVLSGRSNPPKLGVQCSKALVVC